MTEYPSAEEALQKIAAGSRAWRNIIPAEEHDRFVEAVKRAVEIYLNLVSPKDLRGELEAFEKASRSPSAPITQLVSGLSTDAREVLTHLVPLPDPPNSPSGLEAYHNDIRSRLVQGQRWRDEGSKRRKLTEIVGPQKRMGRPSDAKVDVLVSFISAAYAHSTGSPATRSWSYEDDTALERIIQDIFANLLIDDVYSARKALERHIKQRTALQLQSME